MKHPAVDSMSDVGAILDVIGATKGTVTPPSTRLPPREDAQTPLTQEQIINAMMVYSI